MAVLVAVGGNLLAEQLDKLAALLEGLCVEVIFSETQRVKRWLPLTGRRCELRCVGPSVG
jgi:hypothetical protein